MVEQKKSNYSWVFTNMINIGEIFRCDLSHVTNTVAIHSPQTVELLVSTTLVFRIVVMVEQKIQIDITKIIGEIFRCDLSHTTNTVAIHYND